MEKDDLMMKIYEYGATSVGPVFIARRKVIRAAISQLYESIESRTAVSPLLALSKRAHDMSKAHGWWDDVADPWATVPEKLMLIVSELAEALEAYRDGDRGVVIRHGGKPDGFPIELADALIRILDLAGVLGIDLDAMVDAKMKYNATRPHKHGGKAC